MPAARIRKANVDVWHWKDTEAAVGADRSSRAGTSRDAARRLSSLASQARARLGRRDAQRDADAPIRRWAIGRDRHGVSRRSAVGRHRRPTTIASTPRRRAHADRQRTVAHEGHLARRQVVPLSEGQAVFAFNLGDGTSVDARSPAAARSLRRRRRRPSRTRSPSTASRGWSQRRQVGDAQRSASTCRACRSTAARRPTSRQASARRSRFNSASCASIAPAAADAVDAAAAEAVRRGGADERRGIDLSKPLLLSAYGDRTKKSGYWQVAPGGADAARSARTRRSAGRRRPRTPTASMFTRAVFTQFPDYWASTRRFASPTKVTDANPFIDEYAWGKQGAGRLQEREGQKLQGTLTLPANYEPGKKYPMLVYFYEIMSNTHNHFADAGLRRPAALRRLCE